MPATSKEQFKFMAAVAGGSVKKPGLSKEKAKEFIQGVNYNSLPEMHNEVLHKVMMKKRSGPIPTAATRG